MAAVKAIFDPGDVLNPGVMVDPAPLDADLRVPQAAAAAHRARLRLPARRRRPVRRGAPLRRRGQVPGRHHRDRRRHVPVVPGHPGREGLHPGPRAGAAGDSRTARWSAAWRRPEVRRVAGPVPVLQGLLVGLPRRGGHGHLQGRGAVPAVPAPAAPGGSLRAGLAAPLGPAGLARARGWPTPRCALRDWPRWPSGRAGSTPGGRCPGSPRRPSGPGSPRRPAPGPQAGRTPVLLWVDTFTDHFDPGGRPGRRAGAARPPGTRSDHRRAGVLRADLDLHRPARRRPPAAAAQPAGARPALRARHPGRRPRAVLHRRAARRRRRAAARRPARPRWPAAATRTLAELLTQTPQLDAARPGRPARGRPAALPPARRDGLARRRRAARPAGAEVTAVGGCCGLAGNFGVERGHYDVSRAVAETALLPAVRAAGGAMVLADGFSCRTQLDQLAQVPRHPPGPAAGQPPGRAVG